MKIIHNIKEMSEFSKTGKLKNKTIGFVPTMGALHSGHLSLIRRSRKDNDITVVSIFVNPTQFCQNEDFKKYPRNLKQDAELCAKEGVDIIFNPSVKDMYLENKRGQLSLGGVLPIYSYTFISVDDLGNRLCGKSRPGHFSGVVTVVAKLLNTVNPDILYLGQKDAQQAIIIDRMIKDLNIPVKLKVMPIVRGPDGLALSSRNIYLNSRERKDATALYQSLCLAKYLINNGERKSAEILKKMRKLINLKKNAIIDYIVIVNPENLQPVNMISGNYLIALAVKIGKTRLIDNLFVSSPRKRGSRSRDSRLRGNDI